MNNIPKTYIICVEYGDKSKDRLDSLFANKNFTHSCNIIRIRTDSSPGKSISNLNEAYEFSGYQEGLALAIKDCQIKYKKNSDSTQFTFIFINDTWLSGHLILLGKQFIANMIKISRRVFDKPLFVGFKMPANSGIANISGTSSYISTWAFALVGSLDNLENVRFYNEKETINYFEDSYFVLLPDDYRKYLNKWLQPTHLLKGWYKATPGLPLEKSILIRKTLAIFLEHSLPRKLALLGFISVDIGEIISRPRRIIIRILRFMDRINTNYLKIKQRIPFVLMKFIKKYF